jgi:hypothetical protein
LQDITDERDRKLLKELLWFATGEDTAELQNVWPLERIAAKFSTDADDIHRWITDLLNRLLAVRPTWVMQNIERPMSQRLSLHLQSSDEPFEMEGSRSTTSVEERMIARTWELAVHFVSAGADPDSALAKACEEVVGRSGLQAARESDCWPDLLRDLQRTAGH